MTMVIPFFVWQHFEAFEKAERQHEKSGGATGGTVFSPQNVSN